MSAKIRVAKELQEVYFVTCDHCGQEERNLSRPTGDGPHYCTSCWRKCSTNDAFDAHKVDLGAKLVGFRFDGNHKRGITALVLKKGKRLIEVTCRGNYDGESVDEHDLTVRVGLHLVKSCYTFSHVGK